MTAADSQNSSAFRAVIDIGSSALKFAVYDFRQSPPKLVREADPVATSLGRGLLPGGPLPRAGRAASLAAIARFSTEIQALGAELRLVVATAAMRKTSSAEAQAFLAEVRQLVGPGPEIRVISADEEARWALRSAQVMLALDERPRLLVDPGGSSNDFVHLAAGQPRTATLSFGMNDLLALVPASEEEARVSPDDIAKLSNFMLAQYRELADFLAGGEPAEELIGTSGAAIALGACHLGVRSTDRQSRLLAAHDQRVPIAAIEALVKELAPLQATERRDRHPCLAPTRSQIFVHSALIYVALLQSIGLSELRINGYGMKLGGLLQP